MASITPLCSSRILIVSAICLTASLVRAVPTDCNGKMDVHFLIDASESIIEDDPYHRPLFRWDQLKQLLKDIIYHLPISQDETHVSMMTYAEETYEQFTLSHFYNKNDIATNVHTFKHIGGNTNTYRALNTYFETFSQNKGYRDHTYGNIRRILVVFTDGLSNIEADRTAEIANRLKAEGVRIYVISMEQDADEEELRLIASDPPEDHVIRKSFSNDALILRDFVVYNLCLQPVPSPPPPNCDMNMDLAILVDDSGSIRTELPTEIGNVNYDNLKTFLKSLVDILEIGTLRTRVGLVRFSDIANTEFKLNQHNNKIDMQKAIDNMGFEGGYTNISGALRVARKVIFRDYNGDRPEVRNVIIVIADGESNKDAEKTKIEADLLKRAQTKIYSVAVLTEKFDESELQSIASQPHVDYYFNSPSIQNLPDIKDRLLRHVCERETLQTSQNNEKK